MKAKSLLLLSFVPALLTASVGQAAPVSRRVLPVAAALEAARVALADCSAKGYAVAVSIVDINGDLKLLAADPAVGPISIELSQRKARTAALFNAKSGEVGARFQASPGYAQAMNAVEPRLSAAQGALPIIVGKDPVGALGISGAPGGDKDEACAATGLAAIASELR